MSKENRNKTVLAEDVTLYTTKVINDGIYFNYEVECYAYKSIKITLNFENSVNFYFENDKNDRVSNLKHSAVVKPFSRKAIGRLVLSDVKKRAVLKLSVEWIMEPLNQNDIESYLRLSNLVINQAIKDVEVMHIPSVIEDANNAKIDVLLKANNKKFVDLDFLPHETSLYKTSTNNSVGQLSSSNLNKLPVEWRRVSDFMLGPYDIFVDNIEPSDIRQGALGDCWFLCALAALAEFDLLVRELFPDTSASATGAYNVRLCKNGLWRTIRVDDFFPCYPGGGPVYSRSHGNELWVLLLEKAFAKACGSYESIKAGYAYEAMIDLTGSPYKTFRFDDPDIKNKIADGALWTSLVDYDTQKYIMSASTPGEDKFTETGKKPGKENYTGLVAGHAYSLISVKKLRNGTRLVQLRNPWGSMEWSGDWSDTSPLWSQEAKDDVGGFEVADDGTFWMCFEDLLKYFASVNVCMVRHVGLNSAPWIEARRKFYFEHSGAANLNENEYNITSPTYVLTVNKTGQFIISIHQDDIRCINSKPYIDIGVTIMKVNPVYGTFSLVTGTGNSPERQNQSEQIELQPGKYIVVPTTTGCKLAQHLKSESSSMFSDRPLLRTFENGDIDFSSRLYEVYEDIFSRFDCDGDGFLNIDELNQFMLRTEGSTIEEKAYLWLLHNFESLERRGLTCAGFIRAQLFVFKHTGSDEIKLRRELKALGYDSCLNYSGGRGAVLVIHGTADYSLNAHEFDKNAYSEAMELPVINQGDCTELEEGRIKLYKYRSGYKGLSFAIENRDSQHDLLFILDCKGSVNVISHRSDMKYEVTVPTNQARILHHLMPEKDESEGWSWAYSASYMWKS
eukprot:gene14549-19531_t